MSSITFESIVREFVTVVEKHGKKNSKSNIFKQTKKTAISLLECLKSECIKSSVTADVLDALDHVTERIGKVRRSKNVDEQED